MRIGLTCRRPSSRRSLPFTRGRGWAVRRSTPRSSSPATAPGSLGSIRPSMSRTAPTTTIGSGCTWPSIAASPGTSGPCSSRSVSWAALRHRVTVFGDYHAEGFLSEANARAIRARAEELPCRERLDVVRLDPASSARTGVGPAAYGEFERIFGSRIAARWPQHPVLDGLNQLEILLDSACLLIHPRCVHLIAAFQNYARAHRGGEGLDELADPQHEHEDVMDALRGGVRDRFPEGRIEQSRLRTAHA